MNKKEREIKDLRLSGYTESEASVYVLLRDQLANGHEMTTNDVAKLWGRSYNWTYRVLSGLLSYGVIEKYGHIHYKMPE